MFKSRQYLKCLPFNGTDYTSRFLRYPTIRRTYRLFFRAIMKKLATKDPSVDNRSAEDYQ